MTTTAFDGSPRTLSPRRQAPEVARTVASVAVVFLVGIPAGVAVAAATARLQADSIVTATTCIALALPAIIAIGRMRHSRQSIGPLIVALALFYMFVPRLVGFDPSSGLVGKLPLTPQEIASNKTIAQFALIAFALPISLLYLLVPVRRPAHVPDIGDHRDPWRSTLRLRRALVLGGLGSVAGVISGLSLGTAARSFEAGANPSPLGLLGFFSTTVPAGLWLAGRYRLSLVLLIASMVGPYLEGGRQAVLTPLLVLVIAAVGTRSGVIARRRGFRVKVLVMVTAVVIAGVATVVATTSRRAAVETAVHGGERPSLTTTLVDDQTLFDPLLIAVAREPRPQGMAIYWRALYAPVPRAVWPEKPLSYDYEFRQRYFAQYGDAIPISLVGTSFISFAFAGAMAAGLIVGALALSSEALLARVGQRGALMAALLAILALDVLRIGGFYREMLTFFGSAGGVLLITRSRSHLGVRTAMEITGRTLVHVEEQ
jgi:hypothetical protein